MHPSVGLGALLPEAVPASAPEATRVERHRWLIALLQWLHGEAPALRLQRLRQALQARPDLAAAVPALLHRIWREGDAAALFADLGFAPRRGFVGELRDRLVDRLLPATLDTDDLAALFALGLDREAELDWLTALPDDELQAWDALLRTPDAPGWGLRCRRR